MLYDIIFFFIYIKKFILRLKKMSVLSTNYLYILGIMFGLDHDNSEKSIHKKTHTHTHVNLYI